MNYTQTICDVIFCHNMKYLKAKNTKYFLLKSLSYFSVNRKIY